MARVLVIDDEDLVAQVLKDMLESDGHAVTLAARGCACWRRSRSTWW
jgi:CheY-like chemotaxis protein